MKNIWFIIIVLLIGCEEELTYYPPCSENFQPEYQIIPFWISSNCHTNTIKAIVEGSEKFNNFTEKHLCQPRMEIIGIIDIDLQEERINTDTGVNTIVCYYKEPIWFKDSKWYNTKTIANASSIKICSNNSCWTTKYIRFFMFRRQPEIYEEMKQNTMHELMHSCCKVGHLDPETEWGVMTPVINYQSNYYTEDDRQLMCNKMNCVD